MATLDKAALDAQNRQLILDILAHAKMLLVDLKQDFTDTANELQSTHCLREAITAAERLSY